MILAGLLLAPLLAAALVVTARRWRHAPLAIAVAGLLLTFMAGLWAAASGSTAALRWGPGLELRLAVEGFGGVMVILVPLIALAVVAYAAANEVAGRVRLMALMLVFVGAMLLLVTAADFVTLLIAWELVAALSWALIGHDWREPESGRASTEAFITTRLGDLGLYAAAGLLFAATGSFSFDAVFAASRPTLDLIALGVLAAATAKSAQVPFSPWLFAAMAGPTPVSALLHSATLVAAGAYLLIRLAPAFEPVGWFLPAVAAVGLVTALTGGVVATVQTHAKRALAASTSAQYGLMFVAVGAGSAAAGGAHLVAHAAFKALLFLAAGIAVHAAGSSALATLGQQRVVRTLVLLSGLGALALAGVPPLGAAWTKEQVTGAALASSAWLGIGVLFAGFLSALYAARYQVLAFVPAGRVEAGLAPHPIGAGRITVAAMVLLTAVTVALSLLWLPGAAQVVEIVVAGHLSEGGFLGQVLAVTAIIPAFALVWWLARRGRLLSMGLSPGVQARAADWLGLPALTRFVIVGPVTALSGRLAAFDDRVVDAGVRAVARAADLVSSLFSRRGEWAMDGVVHSIARSAMSTAAGSRIADDRVVDGAVESGASGVGWAGQQSRRLQTGQSHHYYAFIAAGVAGILVILVVAR